MELAVDGLEATALDDERQACLAAGMTAHASKPLDPDELVALLARHLARRR